MSRASGGRASRAGEALAIEDGLAPSRSGRWPFRSLSLKDVVVRRG